MQRGTGRSQFGRTAVQVATVVAVPRVEAAAPGRDQPATAQQAQMVRDQVLGLTNQLHQLADPVVTAGQRGQQPPPHRVIDHPDERRRRGRLTGRCHGHDDTSNWFDAISEERCMSPDPSLARRLGTADAVVIGLGSMIGAGVFVAFGPAARAAGTGLLIGLVIAAVIAYCNAMASAHLAAKYPTSGGTYIYGRERLGPWWGFIAGWGFVIGKTASCAAMALTFAAYAVPGPWWAQRGVAVAGVVALAALNYRGVTKTAMLTRALVATSLIALAAVVVGIALGGEASPA